MQDAQLHKILDSFGAIHRGILIIWTSHLKCTNILAHFEIEMEFYLNRMEGEVWVYLCDQISTLLLPHKCKIAKIWDQCMLEKCRFSPQLGLACYKNVETLEQKAYLNTNDGRRDAGGGLLSSKQQIIESGDAVRNTAFTWGFQSFQWFLMMGRVYYGCCPGFPTLGFDANWKRSQ